ncbi:MAG TPA: 4Fe-4S binding protein, partial [Thermoanaerobaculia bacterium]|nr:4Fe-4S binding protein [Thermoanaerobaculia bacterium]
LIAERGVEALVSQAPSSSSRESLHEFRLGALLAALAREGRREIHPRKLRQARESALAAQGVTEVDREPLLAALDAGFESLEKIELSPPTAGSNKGSALAAPVLPAAADRGAEGTAPIAGLARFWDQVGVLYKENDIEHLTPQAALTVPTLPPLSAALPLQASSPAHVPTLEPVLCTGCGQCWTVCPEGAINPLLLPSQALVEGCMEVAQARGASIEPLRMLAGKLAGGVSKALAAAESAALPLPALISSAFDAVMAKSRLSEERKAAVEEAYAALQATLAELPIVRTADFFERAEKRERGSGEVLALAIDPQACTECGLCIAECEPAALAVSDAKTWSPDRENESRERWALCSALPAPSPETLKRAASNPALNPMSAKMLDRSAREMVAGSRAGEPGGGDKVALRQVVAAALSALQPVTDQTLEEVRELHSRLASTIHDKLSAALPADDLSALGRGLAALARPDSDLKDLLTRLESAVEENPVDVSALERLVARATELADLGWRLEKGEGGWGRQPVGLVLGPGRTSDWAGTFPENPFALPVTVDSNGNTAELAAGIASAYEHQTVILARAMRRARIELERPAEAAAHEAGLRALTWSGLTADERRMCPRLIVFVSESEMASSGVPGVLKLLSSHHRVAVLVFTDLELIDDAPQRQTGPWSPGGAAIAADPALLALSQREGFVAQTSIAEPGHLADAVASAMSFDGPGLLRIYTPSPRAHGFLPDQTIERARQAVASRALPLYTSRPPSEPGGMRALDLDGNPGPGYDWYKGLTPADWALGETRYAHLFTATIEDGAEPLASYLRLPASDRESKTAYLELREGTDERLALTPPLLSAIDHSSSVWRSLNAWANVERHLEDAARAEAERLATAELKRQHQDELATLAREQKERLSALGSDIEADLAKRLRARLVELALHPVRQSSEGPRS